MIKKLMIVVSVCIMATFSFHSQVHANASVKVQNVILSPQEFSALPEFLQVRVMYVGQQRHPDFKRWKASIGPDYQHYHHWVLGIVKFNRGVMETNDQKKKFLIKGSVGEYSYVISRCNRTNPHLHILHYQRGMSLMILGELSRAAVDLSTSTALNRNYRPAYEGLAEVYTRLGMQQQADETEQMIDELFGKNDFYR